MRLQAGGISRKAGPGGCERGAAALCHRPGPRLLQYAAMDEFTRLRVLSAYPEQSTFSSVNFLRRRFKQHARRGIRVECVQTDSGFVCTGCFSNRRRDLPALFAGTAGEPEVRHKPIHLVATAEPSATAPFS